MSIRNQMFLLAVLPALLTAIALMIFLPRFQQGGETGQVRIHNDLMLGELAEVAGLTMRLDRIDYLREYVESAAEEDVVKRIILLNNIGTIIADSSGKTSDAEIGSCMSEDQAWTRKAIYPREINHGDTGFRLGTICAKFDDKAVPGWWDDIVSNTVLFAAILAALAIFLAAWFARRLTKPVKRLNTILSRLGEGDFSVRVLENSGGELGSLETGVNRLAEKLEESKKELQNRIGAATAELTETLEEIEVKNVELDIARKNAVQGSAVKSEFLANMSHEIRTPMNGVLGFLELLAKTELNNVQTGYIETIQASAENLLTILNDVLDFSKIEAGKFKIRARSFDLRKVVENSVILFAANARKKGLDFVLDIAPAVPSKLIGDGPRIAQVVSNLVSNAIKFTESGTVEVSVTAQTHTHDEVVIGIRVQDSGSGISEEDQKGLFTAFNQIDASSTRKYAGTGLGLAISQRLVEIMNGAMHIESEESKGSTFYISLPLKRQDPYRSSSNASRSQKFEVLVISPSESLSRSVMNILEFGGGLVHWAGDPAAAATLMAGPLIDYNHLRGIIIDLREEQPLPSSVLDSFRDRFMGLNCPLIILDADASHPQSVKLSAAFARVFYSSNPPASGELLSLLGLNETPASLKVASVVPAEIPGRTLEILLTDDNEINRQLASLFLYKLNANVDEALDGEQAVTASMKKTYDLIFMDVHMPVMDGIAASKAIRANPDNPNVKTPIVALTADAIKRGEKQYREIGINDVLLKPINMAAIESKLDRWCEVRQTKAPTPDPREHGYVS